MLMANPSQSRATLTPGQRSWWRVRPQDLGPRPWSHTPDSHEPLDPRLSETICPTNSAMEIGFDCFLHRFEMDPELAGFLQTWLHYQNLLYSVKNTANKDMHVSPAGRFGLESNNREKDCPSCAAKTDHIYMIQHPEPPWHTGTTTRFCFEACRKIRKSSPYTALRTLLHHSRDCGMG